MKILHTINGVQGMLETIKTPARASGCFDRQRWTSFSRPIDGYGRDARLTVKVRFDDSCGNGHNTFAITAEVQRPYARDIEAGGCLHADITRVFPELAHLIKWHLCSTDGPLHYLSNTVYRAGERDHNGLRKGESRQLRNGRTGMPAWHLMAVIDGQQVPLHDLPSHVDADTCPSAPTVVYAPWCQIGEGKERDFDAARACAIWQDATDEELSVSREELIDALNARLPALLAALRSDIEASGFMWKHIGN